jgi:hypothetical protein
VRLAFLVLAHRGPDQTALLLSTLRDPSSRLYLHVDARVPIDPFSAALTGAGLTTDVTFLRRRPTRWAGPELVDVVCEGLARSLADACDYFLLISGQDFPLRRVDELAAFFEAAPDRSYMTHWALPYDGWRLGGRDRTDFYTYDFLGRRETCIPRGEDVSYLSWRGRTLNAMLRLRSVGKPARRTPGYIRAFGGSQWMNLSAAAVRHIVDFVSAHPEYRRYHEHTLAPDELFFPSILAGTGFAEEHELVNDSLRFMVWPRHERSPRVLRSADLPAIRRAGALFARKLDADADPELVKRLAAEIT